MTYFYETNKSIMEESSSTGKKKRQIKAVPTLSITQKYNVGNDVQDLINNETESNRKSSEKVIDTLRAVLEETEFRIEDLKREAFEFKRAIVIGGENPRTGSISSEKVFKYYEERQKSKDVMLEKLRLKNSSMKVEIQKCESKLRLRDEAGEVLHYIDFHQLQIENKQSVRTIEEKESDLSFFKSSTGACVRTLNATKQDLLNTTNDYNNMLQEVENRKDYGKKLIQECKSIRKYCRQLERKNNEINKQLMHARAMPDINEYIDQRKVMWKMDTDLEVCKKRVGLAKQGLLNSKSKKRAALKELNSNIQRAVTR